jgi:hypothetical protein
MTTVIMLLGVVGSATQIIDIESNTYKKAITILCDFGILTSEEDGSFKPDDNVTRADFAMVVAKVLDISSMIKGENVFSDVKADDLAVDDINAVAKLGFMRGYSDNEFMPEKNISLIEAMKVLVSVTGYDAYAANKGGYPTGYASMANQLGILKGINESLDIDITRALLAKLVFNAINVDILEQKSISSEYTYESNSGVTLLTERLGIYKGSGIITQNEFSSITTDNGGNVGEVAINNKDYHVGKTYAADLLGYNVDFYYKDINEDGELVILSIDTNSKNEVVRIDADTITSYQNNTYYYTISNDKTQNETFSINADVIYNHKMTRDRSNSVLVPNEGWVDIVTNGSGEAKNLVIITSFKNAVVHSTIDDSKIYTKFADDAIEFSPSGLNVKKNITDIDGVSMKVSDLKEGSIITFTESLDKTVYFITDVEDALEGIITQIENDSNGKLLLTIDEDKFFVTNEFVDHSDSYALGDEGVFSLNKFGKIDSFQKGGKTSMNYGYVIDKGMSNGVNKVLKIKMLTTKSMVEVFNCASKVILNEDPTSDHLVVNNALNNINADGTNDGKTKKQLIRYRLNDKNEINSIDIYYIKGKINSATNESFDSLNQMFAGTAPYIADNNTFQNKFVLKSKLPVFIIPSDGLEKDFRVTSVSYFKNDINYAVEAYSSISDTLFAEALVYVKTLGGKIIDTVSVSLVTRVTDFVNDDGDVIKKIYAYQDGKPIEKIIKKNASVTASLSGVPNTPNVVIKKGDLIRYETDIDGNIDNLELMYDGVHLSNSSNSGTLLTNFRLSKWNIYAKDGNYITLSSATDISKTDMSSWEIVPASKQRIYVIDNSGGDAKIRKGSIMDLIDYKTSNVGYSNVVMYTYYGYTRDLFVYK